MEGQKVRGEPRSTFTFTRGLLYIVSTSFTRVRTEKLRGSGNQPLLFRFLSQRKVPIDAILVNIDHEREIKILASH